MSVRSVGMGSSFLVRWAFNVVALFVASWLLSGVSYGDQYNWAVLAILILVGWIAAKFIRRA